MTIEKSMKKKTRRIVPIIQLTLFHRDPLTEKKKKKILDAVSIFKNLDNEYNSVK